MRSPPIYPAHKPPAAVTTPSSTGPLNGHHPLARGASPAVVRQWLLPHDADRFVTEYEDALDTARTSLDLTDVHEVIERWRAIALLQTDPEAYRRTIRRAAELATGRPSPDDEPLDVTTTKAGL